MTKAYFYIYFPFPSLHRDRALTERVNCFFFFQSLYQLFINSISNVYLIILFKLTVTPINVNRIFDIQMYTCRKFILCIKPYSRSPY